MSKLPLSDDDINSFLNQPVMHPSFNKALKHIQKAHSSFGRAPLSCYVTGEPGVGKSFLVKTAKNKILETVVESKDSNTIPVILIKLRPGALPDRVKKMILTELGVDTQGYAGENLDILFIKQLIVCDVVLIIFDEFQHLLRLGDKDVNRNAANFIKTIIDDRRIPVVLTGIPEGKKLFKLSKELRSRIRNAGELEEMSIAEKKSREYFKKFIDKLMSTFPIESVKLTEGDNLDRLYLAIQGNLRGLEDLLSEVLSENREGLKKLEMEDYQAAYEFTRIDELYDGQNKVIAPFTGNISVIKNRLKKPFLRRNK